MGLGIWLILVFVRIYTCQIFIHYIESKGCFTHFLPGVILTCISSLINFTQNDFWLYEFHLRSNTMFEKMINMNKDLLWKLKKVNPTEWRPLSKVSLGYQWAWWPQILSIFVTCCMGNFMTEHVMSSKILIKCL